MQLNPRAYQFEEAVITEASISQHFDMKYIHIVTQVNECVTQGYPACNIPNLPDAIDYLLTTFEISSVDELKGKTVYKVSCFSDIFCLINPENNKIFSLQAHYFPQQYQETIDEIKKQGNFSYLDKLSPELALTVGLLASITAKEEKAQQIKSIVDTYCLSTTLENTLDTKKTQKKNKI